MMYLIRRPSKIYIYDKFSVLFISYCDYTLFNTFLSGSASQNFIFRRTLSNMCDNVVHSLSTLT
jgi:hypothetical protein